MIMRAISAIYILLAVCLIPFLGSCAGDDLPDLPASAIEDGTPVTMTAGAFFPEMDLASVSRSMGDEPSADDLLNNLHVNLFVFDRSGVMLQFIGPENISVLRVDQESRQVFFKVSGIYSSSQPRRLHFVVTSAPDLHAVAGGEYITAMAGETTTMPAITVSGGTDAYWGLRELDSITENMSLHVKLIRNFVKLSVGCSASGDTFRLLGYTVVNRPDRGTVAPFIHRDHLFASFLNPDNDLLSYEEVIAQGYLGVNPAGSDLNMQVTTEDEVRQALDESERRLAAGDSDTPCYIYERSQSSLGSAGADARVTYVIVVGEYRGKRSWYKIDIGHDQDGKFGFYDLLRNFQYTIDITEVGGEGAPSLLDAMNGAAHNNLSASVVTRDLFSIGYQGDMIEVSSTRVVFTERTTDYELRFRYTAGSGGFDPAKLKIYDLTDESREYDMSGVSGVRGKEVPVAGEVIETASVTSGSDGWYVLRVSSRDIPVDSRRYEQNLRIYYSGGTGGLGRTVTFMLRRPWTFSGVSASDVGVALKSSLTLRFTLPSGLSSSLFPLILTFESDKQNIYAVNGSPLTVATGRTGFAGATSDNVMMYEWRIEWADYSHADGSEGGEMTAPFMMNTTAAEDRLYDTSPVDASSNGERTANSGTSGFCIRMANKGQKYIEPIYVNVSRR